MADSYSSTKQVLLTSIAAHYSRHTTNCSTKSYRTSMQPSCTLLYGHATTFGLVYVHMSTAVDACNSGPT